MSQVAQIILSQLGGNRFVAMTGAKSFASGRFPNGNEGLSFKLPRNHSKAKACIITLNGLDLYDMEFLGQRNAPSYEVFPVNNYANLGAEQLAEIFTNETGLYTSL